MTSDQEKVWDRLKHGLQETDGEKAYRLAKEYFDNTEWRARKERLLKEFTDYHNV